MSFILNILANKMGSSKYQSFSWEKFNILISEYTSCSISDQELGCMITKNLLTVIEGIVQASTDDCTNADDNRCNKVFDSLEVTAESGCNVALGQICDMEKCPQNFYSSVCKAHKNKALGTK